MAPITASKAATAPKRIYDFRECKVSVKSETAFPYTVNFPTYTEITLDEIVK